MSASLAWKCRDSAVASRLYRQPSSFQSRVIDVAQTDLREEYIHGGIRGDLEAAREQFATIAAD
jgi:hypothetical protein